MRAFAGIALSLACVTGGCLPYRGDDLSNRDRAKEDTRAEGGGGVDYISVREDALDGRSFTVLLEGPAGPEIDVLTFTHGRLTTVHHGQSVGRYEVERSDDMSIRFWCDGVADETPTRWTGTVWHDKIAGTLRVGVRGVEPAEPAVEVAAPGVEVDAPSYKVAEPVVEVAFKSAPDPLIDDHAK